MCQMPVIDASLPHLVVKSDVPGMMSIDFIGRLFVLAIAKSSALMDMLILFMTHSCPLKQ